MNEVAVGVVRRDGHVLITRRPPTGPGAGLDEFPGGHREPGEALEACLRRELWEETGYHVTPRSLLACVRTHSARGTLWIWFFDCAAGARDLAAPATEQPRWVPVEELPRLAMPAANRRVVEFLVAAHARGGSGPWR